MQHKSFESDSGSDDDEGTYEAGNGEAWSAGVDDHWWATPFDWDNSRDQAPTDDKLKIGKKDLKDLKDKVDTLKDRFDKS